MDDDVEVEFREESYVDIVEGVDVFGYANPEDAKRDYRKLGHIDLVGVHFSVKNAGEFARFVREQRGSPYLVIVGARARTGCVDHFKDGIEKGQIPYDMISYKQDWRESITTVIERLVRCLNETEEERCLKK